MRSPSSVPSATWPQHQPVGRVEDPRVLDAHAGQRRHVEEAPVVQLLDRDPPVAQPVVLALQRREHVARHQRPGRRPAPRGRSSGCGRPRARARRRTRRAVRRAPARAPCRGCRGSPSRRRTRWRTGCPGRRAAAPTRRRSATRAPTPPCGWARRRARSRAPPARQAATIRAKASSPPSSRLSTSWSTTSYPCAEPGAACRYGEQYRWVAPRSARYGTTAAASSNPKPGWSVAGRAQLHPVRRHRHRTTRRGQVRHLEDLPQHEHRAGLDVDGLAGLHRAGVGVVEHRRRGVDRDLPALDRRRGRAGRSRCPRSGR